MFVIIVQFLDQDLQIVKELLWTEAETCTCMGFNRDIVEFIRNIGLEYRQLGEVVQDTSFLIKETKSEESNYLKLPRHYIDGCHEDWRKGAELAVFLGRYIQNIRINIENLIEN